MIFFSKEVGDFLKKNQLKLATAESCTAGLISSIVAETPGSSAWLEAGFVVYTPEAKHKMLGVQFSTIEKHDITSREVAEEMAIGALENSAANVAVSTTGLAGPGGGTVQIPCGTVCFAWAFQKNGQSVVFSEKQHFEGSRNFIREQAAQYALSQIAKYFDIK